MRILKQSNYFILYLLLLSCSRVKPWEKAEKLIEKGEYIQAERVLLNSDTTNPKIKILMGKIYTNTGRYEKALSTLKGIKKSFSYDTKVKLFSTLINLAQIAREIGYRYIGKEAYEAILEYDPEYDLGEGFFFLAEYYFSLGKYLEAFKYYREYLASGGRLEEFLPSYLRTLFELKKYDEIIALRDSVMKGKSAEIDWIVGNALFEEAKSKFETGHPDSAIIYGESFIKWGAPKVLMDDVYFIIGKAYEFLDDTINAIKAYRESILYSQGRSPLKDSAKIRIEKLTP